MKKAIVAGIAAIVFTGCVQVEETVALIPGETTIYTTESDPMGSSSSAVLGALGKNYVSLLSEISTDAVIKVQNNELYVLERKNEESNIRKVSPTGTVIYQKKILYKFNPHDLVVVNDSKGYVCSNNMDSIAVFNPQTGVVKSYIPVNQFGKTGILTNATKMELIGSDLYVACQMGYGSEGSLILVLNTNSDKVTGSIRCNYSNVTDMDILNGKLIVTSPGSWGGKDGGIEEIDPSTKSVKTLISGEKLGFDIASLAIDETRGEFYGSLYQKWGTAPLVRYDSKFTPIDTLDGIIQSWAMTFDQAKGKLYCTEYSTTPPTVPGIIVYDPSTGKSTKTATTLVPSSIAFITEMVAPK